MRKMLLTLTVMVGTSVSAEPTGHCSKIEYAQLKDSTRKELSAAYCRAINRAKLAEDLRGLSEELLAKEHALRSDTRDTEKTISERYEMQISCVGVAEDVEAMLKKKFKAAAPKCEAN